MLKFQDATALDKTGNKSIPEPIMTQTLDMYL